MRAVVADASIIVELLLRSERGAALADLMLSGDATIHVPALCDVEVASVLRRGMLTGRFDAKRTGQALQAYVDLPLTRHGHTFLLPRILSLRANFSAYDATYVALAEHLEGALLSADAGLANAARRLGTVDVP